jgi:hypothetical protein
MSAGATFLSIVISISLWRRMGGVRIIIQILTKFPAMVAVPTMADLE